MQLKTKLQSFISKYKVHYKTKEDKAYDIMVCFWLMAFMVLGPGLIIISRFDNPANMHIDIISGYIGSCIAMVFVFITVAIRYIVTKIDTLQNEQQIRADERNKVYDELGVLHGDAAKKFIDYMNDPHDITPEGAALLEHARKLANDPNFNPSKFVITDREL